MDSPVNLPTGDIPTPPTQCVIGIPMWEHPHVDQMSHVRSCHVWDWRLGFTVDVLWVFDVFDECAPVSVDDEGRGCCRLVSVASERTRRLQRELEPPSHSLVH